MLSVRAQGGGAVNVSDNAHRLPPSANAMRLPHTAMAVSPARRRIRVDLAELGIPEHVLDDVEMVVSELLGNSVRHARPIAGGILLMAWKVTQDEIVIKVTDGGGGRGVEQRESGPMADSGRGLQIVERLSRCWGVADHAGGLRTVWAAMPLTDRRRGLRLVT
jgi:anti-sigma regulatory factor (Ser/Thr protein kinase)